MLVQKLGLRIQRLLRLRQVEAVPEGVRQRVEDRQPGIYACAQKGAMKVDGAAKTVIAGGSHAQSRWESFEIRVHGRKHRIVAVVVSDIGTIPSPLSGSIMALKSLRPPDP